MTLAVVSSLAALGMTVRALGMVELPDTSLGCRRGLRARDPDGHVIQLVEP
jgi:hypothetical protein